MINDILLEKCVQLSQWVLASQRQSLERELDCDWNATISQQLDACLELGEALARFQRYLIPVQSSRRGQRICGLPVDYAKEQRSAPSDALHDFEPVGAILRRIPIATDPPLREHQQGAI